MRVPLVEDDAMIGESLREALRGQGFAADWVRDGRAADAALSTERFDAVLLDLRLPQRSGLDVLKAPRARRRAKSRGAGARSCCRRASFRCCTR